MTAPVLDFKAICDALAARFTEANIGHPTGEQQLRNSYAQTPKDVSALPVHLLEVQDGTVTAASGQWKHEMSVDGLLLVAKRQADTVRPETTRQRWLPYLLHATADALKITLGGAVGYTVDKAIPAGWEWDEYDVGSNTYHAVRVHWTVYVTENVSLVP